MADTTLDLKRERNKFTIQRKKLKTIQLIPYEDQIMHSSVRYKKTNQQTHS